jgi:hypothetical protein
MDSVPVTGLDELDAHLNELLQDPNIPINAKLFDDVELQLTGTSSLVQADALVVLLS